MKLDDFRQWISLAKKRDAFHEILCGHRTFHVDGDGHDKPIFRNTRNVEFDFARSNFSFAVFYFDGGG